MQRVCVCVCAVQERWLDNRDCAYMQGSSGELPDGERRLKRFVPFSDGIKNCLGQVSIGSCVGLTSGLTTCLEGSDVADIPP